MGQKYTLARFLHRIFTEDRFAEKRRFLTEECDISKIMLLWEILFETDVRDRDLLETRIYHYGSVLKDSDYFGRELFVCLVTLLELI